MVSAGNAKGESANCPPDAATPRAGLFNIAFGGTAGGSFGDPDAEEGAAKAFDLNPGSKWRCPMPCWLRHDLGGGTTGAWTHVAVTRSGNTVSLYVNGSLSGSGIITITPSDLGITTRNYLGRSQWAVAPYLNAALGDFRIYSQAMRASEITALANRCP